MKIDDLLNLKGRTALVTGSSQGIGKAIAIALAEKGANVLIHYRGEKKLAEEVLSEIRGYNVKTGLIQADLADVDAPSKIYRESKKLIGPVDILVLNASVQIRKQWQEITTEDFELQMNVNVRSSLMLIQKFVPYMQEQEWGKILTIGSVQQKRAHADMLVYSTGKSGVVNMVRSLAVQLAHYKINVNNLAPGVIYTQRNKTVLEDETYFNLVRSKIPAGYIANPVDCAALSVLLCSDAGRYITGEDIFVDGGMNIPS